MKAQIIKPGRNAMRACDECGFWPKQLIEIGLAKSPMVAALCPSCAIKLAEEINECWQGKKEVL